MYEQYYWFTEKPFSLTPDPKYLYRSESHANAFDLLQYAIRRREGFVVITGDIGTGKTTLCRAILEELDRQTFTALVLNPFLSEEDLLKVILQDFGVVSRDEVKRGRLTSVTKQELIETLNDFLLSLLPLKAGAIVIIDEAQNLPMPVLEQIRILSNLETDKEKLLQIVLVGQLNLQSLLRSPQMRQLDQRVSIRYELKPLTQQEVASYIAHRLAVAGGANTVSFTPRAVDLVHRLSGGIPRLVNLVCDRSLLGGYLARTNRVDRDIVVQAAESLEMRMPSSRLMTWLKRPAVGLAASGLGAALVVAATGAGIVYQEEVRASATRQQPVLLPPVPPPVTSATGDAPQVPAPAVTAATPDVTGAPAVVPATAVPATKVERESLSVTADAVDPTGGQLYAVLVGSFQGRVRVARLIADLQARGYRAYDAEVNLGERGRWRRVLVGPYQTVDQAGDVEAELKTIQGLSDAKTIKVPY